MTNENTSPDNVMEQIRLKLVAMGYIVRSSPSNSSVWYAVNDTKGELHSVIWENERVRVNDINGIHGTQRQKIETEVNEWLK